jgi:hypothetical protein
LHDLTAAHLDHGYYYEDIELPIVLAPEASFGSEWRFIVAEGHVVASSAYEAAMRRGAGASVPREAHEIAERITAILPAPDPVFVLDLVDTPDGIRLLELNPFSGADLYDCNPDNVVTAVAALR